MPITYALNQHAVGSPTTLKGKGITEIVPILEVCGVKVDEFGDACKMSVRQSCETRHGLYSFCYNNTNIEYCAAVLVLCTRHSSDLHWEEYKRKLNISINGLTEKPTTLLLLFSVL